MTAAKALAVSRLSISCRAVVVSIRSWMEMSPVERLCPGLGERSILVNQR